MAPWARETSNEFYLHTLRTDKPDEIKNIVRPMKCILNFSFKLRTYRGPSESKTLQRPTVDFETLNKKDIYSLKTTKMRLSRLPRYPSEPSWRHDAQRLRFRCPSKTPTASTGTGRDQKINCILVKIRNTYRMLAKYDTKENACNCVIGNTFSTVSGPNQI